MELKRGYIGGVAADESADGDSGAPRGAASTPLQGPLPRFDSERFELVREIGRGGYGVVYEAIDHGLKPAPVVALKLLRGLQADRLYRFKREFRALAEVRHENLVRLYELVVSDHDVFFTMERVEGVSPIDHVRARPHELRSLLRQLTQGVEALHRAGKLHRDVKPSNVLVEASGRVVLLDFGLAVDLDVTHTFDRAGTPRYMSPEQCAERSLDAASDWYAGGAMLFELLTGRAPFEGTVLQVIQAKQSQEAPRASSFAPDVPADLDELCAALLSRDPAARPSGDAILRRLDAPCEPRSREEPLARREPFVGRAREKDELWRRFEESLAGRLTVVLARGPSGIGKSALLRCCLEEIRRRRPETMILSGRCCELESVPYKAFDAVVDDLARQLRRLPPVEAAALLPRTPTPWPRSFRIAAGGRPWAAPIAPREETPRSCAGAG